VGFPTWPPYSNTGLAYPFAVSQPVDRTPTLEERLLGQVIAGKYHLVEARAGGAFGTVFRADQFFCKQFVRPVAVKVSHQTGLTEETAAGVFGDALILAQLLSGNNLPGKQHLVPIYDLGILAAHERRGFLAMEYVDGFPLLSHIHAAGRIGVAVGLRYVKEICRGLSVVHSQGAVHRDLKPDNVLVDRSGVVRLVDFGLAGFTDTQLGFAPGLLGTFTYMAPETLHGRSTPAADVYGLGLIIYELFSGGGPHLTAPWPEGGDESRRHEHYRIKTSLVFAPPSQAHNEIRNDYRWLDALVQRCLAVRPEDRFADAGQVLAAIETCEAGGDLPEPIALPPERDRAVLPAFIPDPPPLGSAPAQSGREVDELFREVRKLLASRAYDQVIDRLDIHRPAEWQVVDLRSARALKALGQAYLGLGNFPAARECLEQLRAAQREQAVLPRPDHAAALSDLAKCYQHLGFQDLADACQKEVRLLIQNSSD
jgi:serine/threonine protein kinase